MLLDFMFEFGKVVNFFDRIRQKIPVANGSIIKSLISLTFDLRDNEVEWATPGTVFMDGCSTGKI